MKNLIFLLTASLSSIANANSYTPNEVRKIYDEVAIDMVSQLQTKQCRTLSAEQKAQGKSILECRTNLSGSLLSIDAINNEATGLWLMFNASLFANPADIWRSAGMLIRVARGGSLAGNHLAIGQEALRGMQSTNTEYCVTDAESSANLCLFPGRGDVYNMTLDFAK